MAQEQEPRSTHGRLALEQQHGTAAVKKEQSLQHQCPCGGLVEIVLQGENVVGLLESWRTFLTSLPFLFCSLFPLPSPPRFKKQQSFDDAGLRAASPSYGLYDDDGDSDDDEDSIMVSQSIAHPLCYSLFLLTLILSLYSYAADGAGGRARGLARHLQPRVVAARGFPQPLLHHVSEARGVSNKSVISVELLRSLSVEY